MQALASRSRSPSRNARQARRRPRRRLTRSLLTARALGEIWLARHAQRYGRRRRLDRVGSSAVLDAVASASSSAVLAGALSAARIDTTINAEPAHRRQIRQYKLYGDAVFATHRSNNEYTRRISGRSFRSPTSGTRTFTAGRRCAGKQSPGLDAEARLYTLALDQGVLHPRRWCAICRRRSDRSRQRISADAFGPISAEARSFAAEFSRCVGDLATEREPVSISPGAAFMREIRIVLRLARPQRQRGKKLAGCHAILANDSVLRPLRADRRTKARRVSRECRSQLHHARDAAPQSAPDGIPAGSHSHVAVA